jgi:diacylglycerol kinase family enzyme
MVAVGGDGTLKFLAENLMHTGMPIAFLPAGSANGMAKELCMPADIRALLDIAVNGFVKKMDAININGHISIHLSDLGLNAQLVKYFEEKKMRGMLGYGMQVMRVMMGKQQMNIQVTSGGASKPVRRKAWMLVFANARMYGTGTEINPKGDLYDGRFEIVLFKRLWLWEMIRMMLKQRRFDRKKTEIVCVEKVKIELDQPAHFQVDGEYIGEEKTIEAFIEKGAVSIVVAA